MHVKRKAMSLNIRWGRIEAAGGTAATILARAGAGEVPSLLKRAGALRAGAVAVMRADKVVAHRLVVALGILRVEALHVETLQRVTRKAIGLEFLGLQRDAGALRIEVAVDDVAELVRVDRIEHRAQLLLVGDAHPTAGQHVLKLAVIEDASALGGVRAHRRDRFVNPGVRPPHLVELRDDGFVGVLRRTRELAACLERFGRRAAGSRRERELLASGCWGRRSLARGHGGADLLPVVVGTLSMGGGADHECQREGRAPY